MLSSPRRTVQTLLGVLTFVKLLTYVPAVVRSFVSFPVSTLFSLFGVILVLLLASGSVAVYSLLRDWARGFSAYYLYGLTATLGMASFVTLFPSRLFILDSRVFTGVVITYNLLICLLVAYLQNRARFTSLRA